jgi:hypothetical protein
MAIDTMSHPMNFHTHKKKKKRLAAEIYEKEWERGRGETCIDRSTSFPFSFFLFLAPKQKRCNPIKRIYLGSYKIPRVHVNLPRHSIERNLTWWRGAIDVSPRDKRPKTKRKKKGRESMKWFEFLFFSLLLIFKRKRGKREDLRDAEYLISWDWCIPKCRSSSSRAPLDWSPIPRIPIPLRKVVRRRRSGSGVSPFCKGYEYYLLVLFQPKFDALKFCTSLFLYNQIN